MRQITVEASITKLDRVAANAFILDHVDGNRGLAATNA